MSYAQARQIIYNPEGYTRRTLLMAVAVILATMTAPTEDVDQAYTLFEDPSCAPISSVCST